MQANGLNWIENYTYDGYGNLLQMNPTGTAKAPSMNLAVALDSNGVPTNRINAQSVTYDNNGTETPGFGGLSLGYDAVNRVTSAGNGAFNHYAYDSGNLRIYAESASGAETIYFYSVDGKKLAAYTYAITQEYGNQGPLVVQLDAGERDAYFLGKLSRRRASR